jgi:hypothetical protein
MDQGTSQLVGGFAASCGVLLMVAGASKVYRAARGFDGDTAIRRALRVPRPRWRRVEQAAGVLEVVTGLVVCAGASPLPGHAAAAAVGGGVMAGLGAAFCTLLGYARARRVTGGCGCIEWRPSAVAKAAPVSWREIARSAVLLTAGVAGTWLGRGTGGFRPAWFGAGLVAGGVVMAGLSLRQMPRTPVCRRPLWLPGRATLRALTGHGVFVAMAEAAGPFGPDVRYRRNACVEEFWFTPVLERSEVPAGEDAPGPARAVVFQARYAAPGRTLAVQASVRDGRDAAGEMPGRPRARGLNLAAGPRLPTLTRGLSSYWAGAGSEESNEVLGR